MTLNVYSHSGPEHLHVSCTPPSGATLSTLMRLDQNGRTIWTGEQLGAPWSGYIADDTAALAGAVEYVATYSDGTSEAASRTFAGTERPRLTRLAWTAGGALTAAGSIWTEHDAVIDATYDQQDVSTVSRRGVGGVHSTRNYDRIDTGRLVIWCNDHASARNLRDDLLEHPLQWLRAPDQAGMDHALIVTGLAVRTEAEAWMVDLTYESRPDLTVTPHPTGDGHGDATLGDHTGTLGSLAATYDMLAEMR